MKIFATPSNRFSVFLFWNGLPKHIVWPNILRWFFNYLHAPGELVTARSVSSFGAQLVLTTIK